MRQSKLISKTLKEPPKDSTAVSHKLLVQGGFIHQVSAGLWNLLPLGWRVFRKIDQIIREEFEKRGVQDLLMPVIHPGTLWEESGRINTVDVLATFTSRRDQTMVIAPTHEETISDIARTFVKSYKDLPVIMNQNQTKFRDEVRVQGGILRTREFIMQDAYSFDRDVEGMQKSYQLMKEAYVAIFERVGIDAIPVAADSGDMGGDGSEEFISLAEVGEDRVALCDNCDYCANLEKATSIIQQVEQDADLKEMEAVEGKGLIGVEPLAKFLNIPVEQTTKTILFETDKGVVAAAIRGDFDINETKLKNALGLKELQLASPETVKKLTKAEVGYAGLVDLPEEVTVIGDHSMEGRVNFEMGANKTDYHNINVNFDRDFPTPQFADIREVRAGETCGVCKKGKLRIENGIELGHIFQLGRKYSDPMKIRFVDEDGKEKPVEMGCYGIGMTRLIGAIIETEHDDRGIIWPKNIAPYQVHLIGLNLDKDESLKEKADQLYQQLQEAGVEVLYDDRKASPGNKFADSDLMGIPLRLTISSRSLENGGIEWKERSAADSEIVPKAELPERVQNFY